MRKTIKKICAAALALVFVCAGASGCSSASFETLNAEGLKFVQRGDDGLLELIRTSENLTFYTSDDSLTEFMNDFYSRHIRAGEESIGTARMGACWSYAKEWEALSLSWFDSTALALKEYDADALMQRYINSIDIDKFGNAYVWFNDTDFPVDSDAYDMPGQGWVFPDYSELGTYGSEFSQSADGWTVGGKSGSVSGGYLNGSFYGKEGETYDLISAETYKTECFQHGLPAFWKTMPLKIKFWGCYLPLLCGIASSEQAERMARDFAGSPMNAAYGVRTLAKDEKMYNLAPSGNPSNWLGACWTIANYALFQGFLNYGFWEQAREIFAKTIRCLSEDIKSQGSMSESYHPDTGKPILHNMFFSWNCLAASMIRKMRDL